MSNSHGADTTPIYADLAFPELSKQLQRSPEIVSKIKGLIRVNIFQKGTLKSTWFVILKGRDQPPIVTQTRPDPEQCRGLQGVLFECEDKDFLKIITGGMNGIKAYSSGKLRIEGDLQLARKVEDLFIKANGAQQVSSVLSRRFPSVTSKL